MRLALLILFFTVCISAFGWPEYGANALHERTGNVGGEIKTLFEKILNTTNAFKVHEAFAMLHAKIRKTLELTPEMTASLNQRLTMLRPIKHVRVNEMGDTITEVNERSKIAGFLFQGDIVLTDEQIEDIKEDVEEETSGMIRQKRQAYKDWKYPNTIWSKRVNYYFDYSASDRVRSVFRKAAKQWESDTCIDIKENSRATDRIRVFREDGCWSYVGRRGREQDLSLGRGCESIATAAHELGHALGMFHTMSRHDRDRFITLYVRNIKANWLDQFARQTPHTNENYGITYDYGSIMHYGGTSASVNGRATMVPFDTNYQETLGSPFISFYDLLMMNTHYNCLDKCKNVATPCEMGGVPHPRNCSRCLCPGGYSGRLCNERPSGCGEVLTATTEYKDLKSAIGSHYMRESEDFEKCNYWIEAPKGTTIQVKIDRISGSYAVDGCPYFGVEIKSQKDQRATGYRFCAREDAGVTLMSHSNRVPVIIYSREGRTNIKLQYRYVSNGKPGTEPEFTTTAPVTTTRTQTRVTTYPPRPTRVTTYPPRPTRVTTYPPKPVVVTMRPLPVVDGFFCVDSPSCVMLSRMGFCYSPQFPVPMKMAFCPKLCGFCQ